MATLTGKQLYDRLMALKPDDLTEAAWARKADVSSSFFQDLRKKNTAPKATTLEAVLSAIGVTMAQFSLEDSDLPPAFPRAPAVRPPMNALEAPVTAFRGQEYPRNIPVLGTAEGAEMIFTGEGNRARVTPMLLEPTEVVDYVRRPPAIAGRKDVYALYVVGNSMEPRFRPGEVVYVDPRRQPSIGDDVIVQLLEENHPADESPQIVKALVKNLVRRTATHVELRQYQPDTTFRIEKRTIASIHRILSLSDLVAF